MNTPSWLSVFSPGELKLMDDIGDVIKRTALKSWQGTTTAAEIRREIERRRTSKAGSARVK
jgi:hypothetical protein